MSSTTQNPFDVGDDMAMNYASARPYYHPRALLAALATLGDVLSNAAAVDVGCGTGLSTRALADVAGEALGFDPSPNMLRAGPGSVNAQFVLAAAEAIPLRDGVAGLITCAASMHWFSAAAFGELARIAAPGAVLAVYSDFFVGVAPELPAFAPWLAEVYLPRLPAPPRREHYNERHLSRVGFELVATSDSTYEVALDRPDLRRYLMTQSNFTTAVSAGQSVSELCDWIDEELGALLGESRWGFNFAYRTWTAARQR